MRLASQPPDSGAANNFQVTDSAETMAFKIFQRRPSSLPTVNLRTSHLSANPPISQSPLTASEVGICNIIIEIHSKNGSLQSISNFGSLICGTTFPPSSHHQTYLAPHDQPLSIRDPRRSEKRKQRKQPLLQFRTLVPRSRFQCFRCWCCSHHFPSSNPPPKLSALPIHLHPYTTPRLFITKAALLLHIAISYFGT